MRLKRAYDSLAPDHLTRNHAIREIKKRDSRVKPAIPFDSGSASWGSNPCSPVLHILKGVEATLYGLMYSPSGEWT